MAQLQQHFVVLPRSFASAGTDRELAHLCCHSNFARTRLSLEKARALWSFADAGFLDDQHLDPARRLPALVMRAQTGDPTKSRS
jgi:hypothetical protein